MKKFFYIKDTHYQISYYHLMCFLIALPFDSFYSELTLISFSIHTAINIKKERLLFLLNKKLLLLTSLYLLSVIAILYSHYQPEGISLLTRQLAILLFPLLFTLNEIDLNKYKLPLLTIFGMTCIVATLFLYVDAMHIILYFNLPFASIFKKEFINQNFSHPLDIHATYLSMYIALSLTTFIYQLLAEKKITAKIIYSFCILILLAGLIQLSSRAVIAAMIVIILIAFPIIILKGKKKWQFFILSLLSLFIIFTIVKSLPSFKERFTNELKDDLTQPSATNKIGEPRLVRWQAETEVIKKSPLIGYGTGSEIPVLKEKYFEKKLYLSYIIEFNAHSQYLCFLISFGIIGLVLFLFILYYCFYTGIKNKDILFLSFLLIIVVTSISEDILNVNKGIFFYGFFMPFFLFFQTEQIKTGIEATA